jgi:prepilin-type N-terminal cleavage/methylation domain-containing protein
VRLSGLLSRLRREQYDDGFSMIEVVVAIMIIGIVMTAAAGFFINSLRTTGGQSQRQEAVTLVDRQLENAQSTPFGQLLSGRTATSVTALLATSGAAALTVNDDTSNAQAKDYDPAATASSTPTIPTSTAMVANHVTYTVRTFIDPCWLPVATAQSVSSTSNLACGKTYSASTSSTLVQQLLRITVSASWVGGTGTNCTSGCSYSGSTLADNNPDSKFNSNISQPTLSAATNPANASSSLGAGATATLTLTGNSFQAGAIVTTTCPDCIVGTVGPIFSASLTVPFTAGTTPGTYTIAVVNPDGGRTTSVNNFTITPDPTGLTASPATARNYVTTSVTVSGTNVVNATLSGSAGTWGTSTAGTNSATASFTPSGSTIGSAPITVTNADLGSGTAPFTVVTSSPTLTTTSVGPYVAGQTYTVTLAGTDFGPTGSVNVTATGGTASGITSTTTANGTGESTTFTFVPNGASIVSFGVTNADGGTTGTVAGSVTRSTPKITGLMPTTGLKRGSTYTFVITGTGFTTVANPTVTMSYAGSALYSGPGAAVSSTSVTFPYTVPSTASLGVYTVTLQVADSDGGTTSTYTTILTVTS